MTTGIYCISDWLQGATNDLSPAFSAVFDRIDSDGANGAAILVPRVTTYCRHR